MTDPATDQLPDRAPSRGKAAIALLLLVPVPTIGVLTAMRFAPGTALGKGVFMASKVWLFAFPLIWMLLADRERPRLPRLTLRGMPMAVLTGLAIVAVIGGGYLLLPENMLGEGGIAEKAREYGLKTPWIYFAGCVYWCTINSLLEEYVWRWFVFRKTQTIMPGWNGKLAVLATGLFFTLHHAVALTSYFDPGIVAAASLGVFIGGVTWSWLYLRYQSIWPGYVSHVFADLIIFIIGYCLIFGQSPALT